MSRKLFTSGGWYTSSCAAYADAVAHQLRAGRFNVTCFWLASRYSRKTGKAETASLSLSD